MKGTMVYLPFYAEMNTQLVSSLGTMTNPHSEPPPCDLGLAGNTLQMASPGWSLPIALV